MVDKSIRFEIVMSTIFFIFYSEYSSNMLHKNKVQLMFYQKLHFIELLVKHF